MTPIPGTPMPGTPMPGMPVRATPVPAPLPPGGFAGVRPLAPVHFDPMPPPAPAGAAPIVAHSTRSPVLAFVLVALTVVVVAGALGVAWRVWAAYSGH
jgi:hypothetical protein